jgi:GTP cyclohydrolase III
MLPHAVLCRAVLCALLQRVGVGPTGDILDIIASWPAEEQQRAHAAIEEIEDQALKDMQVGVGNERGVRLCMLAGR